MARFTSLRTAALAATALLSFTCNAAPSDFTAGVSKRDSTSLKFPFGKTKVRGVNIGGWLVLEPWITPSIFEATEDSVIDEWTMGESLGYDEFEKRQQKHWSTWITEKDFEDIASVGLNFVRIPIGYWSITPIEGDPYVQGAYPYLGKALDWADKNGLKVMIDLHGAPGSQNGYDNSGRKGDVHWTEDDTVTQTYTALNKLRDDHASHPALAAIELLNEPQGPIVGKSAVEAFYQQGYDNLKSHKDLAISIQDAYEGIHGWDSFVKDKENMIIDHHHYQIFKKNWITLDKQGHIQNAKDYGKSMATSPGWSINGEWTAAMTDCAKWLNGRGQGARYDATFDDGENWPYLGSCDGKVSGTVDDLSSQEKDDLKTYFKVQQEAFELADGWIYWCWKTEAAPEWDYKQLTAAGIIPKFSQTDNSDSDSNDTSDGSGTDGSDGSSSGTESSQANGGAVSTKSVDNSALNLVIPSMAKLWQGLGVVVILQLSLSWI